VILADKDMTSGWGGAADGTREKRVYLLQNWRADVSCVTDQNGKVLEWVKYSPYGVPFRIDPADFDRDGDVDSSDSSAFTTEYNNGGPRADANHDGFIDFTDYDVYMDNHAAASAGGRNVLSRGGTASSGIHNRIGYAGYLWDSATSQYHVRNRVFLPSLGRWSRRDPIGYASQDMNLFAYVWMSPVTMVDALGLFGDCTTKPHVWVPDYYFKPFDPDPQSTFEPNIIRWDFGTLHSWYWSSGSAGARYWTSGEIDAYHSWGWSWLRNGLFFDNSTTPRAIVARGSQTGGMGNQWTSLTFGSPASTSVRIIVDCDSNGVPILSDGGGMPTSNLAMDLKGEPISYVSAANWTQKPPYRAAISNTMVVDATVEFGGAAMHRVKTTTGIKIVGGEKRGDISIGGEMSLSFEVSGASIGKTFREGFSWQCVCVQIGGGNTRDKNDEDWKVPF